MGDNLLRDTDRSFLDALFVVGDDPRRVSPWNDLKQDATPPTLDGMRELVARYDQLTALSGFSHLLKTIHRTDERRARNYESLQDCSFGLGVSVRETPGKNREVVQVTGPRNWPEQTMFLSSSSPCRPTGPIGRSVWIMSDRSRLKRPPMRATTETARSYPT
jgi:hypothetical protein